MFKTFKKVSKVKDNKGNEPVHYASWHRNKHLVELLIKNGADINCQNNDGNSPLHLSCAANDSSKDYDESFEKFLFENGSDVNLQNNLGKTPVMLLFEKEGEIDFFDKSNRFDPFNTLMIFKGINLSLVDHFERNLFHYACIRGAKQSAIHIFSHKSSGKSKNKQFVGKIDLNFEDFSVTTPFGYALKNAHENLCLELITRNHKIPEIVPVLYFNKDNPLFQ